MIIEIKKIAKNLKVTSPDLITRPTGKRFFSKIMEKLTSVHPGEVVILDFYEIKVLDTSFIDECIINLIKESRREKAPFYVKLENISESIESNIEFVIKSYFSMDNEKIAVALDRMGKSQGHYIGLLSGPEKDIIDFLMVNRHVPAGEIAAYIDIPEEQAKKILDKLYYMRLVRRNREKETCYYSPV